MWITAGPNSRVALLMLAVLLATGGPHVLRAQAEHVRWDIVSLNPGPPVALDEGGVAFAWARFPSSLKIKLTGSGTFVAPATGGPSSAVTGGGTWETFSGCPAACVSTGSGTYWATRLLDWQFAGFFVGGPVDLIGPNGANGNAVLRIAYSDGSRGTLGIGCHGPGSPDGIVEGVIATKDYVTYWDAAGPVPGVDENRTAFHIE